MEVYRNHVITTYFNDKKYWVARVAKGDYKGLCSWQPRKKIAVNLLKSTLDEKVRDQDAKTS